MSDTASTTPTAMSAASEPGLRGQWAALRHTLWTQRDARERRLLLLAGLVLGAYLLWAVALAPAWRTVRAAPAQIDALDAQLQDMAKLASEAQTLRAVPPVPLAQAQAALGSAVERLGATAKLSLQGERALVTLKGISGEQLSALLQEARAGARAKVIEANLNQSGPGLYDGSLAMAFGGPR
jgi:general secretion pathway protein M